MFLTGLFLLGFSFCQKPGTAAPVLLYDTVPKATPLSPLILESSGLAASRKNPGILWVQEDSGQPAALIALGTDGVTRKQIPLKGAENRDWEDMAFAAGELYIGDIGDNSLAHNTYFIYHFPEPSLSTDTITQWSKITFMYPDGSHDAEALLVDPASRAIYIITKRDQPARIYKIGYPYGSGTVTAEWVGNLGYSGVVSAALSPDGKEILVKTYFSIQRYGRKGNEELSVALSRAPQSIPYKVEPQGEAIGFAADQSGFYTVSEKGFAASVVLYFYPKK